MKERSIFWPLAMIAAGVLWLLVGMGYIPHANLWALTHILPFLLIALGLGLILRAYWRFAGMLVALLVVVGAVLAVVYAPQLGWNNTPDWTVWNFGPDFGGSLPGSGVIKTETRQITDLDAVTVDYPADIIIRQGDKSSLTITADDNLLPQLRTDVQNGNLTIENSVHNWNQRVRPTETVQVTLTVQNLHQVAFTNAGQLHIEGLKTDNLNITVSGAGDLNLSELEVKNLSCFLSGAGNFNADGTADNITVRISGFGNFNGGDLQTQSADANISGAGNATLWVESQLDANISGAGSIRYYGTPTVTKHVSGVGDVRNLGEK